MKRYLVIIRKGDVFVFDSQSNAKSFVNELREKQVKFATSEFGFDEMEARGG